MYQPAHFVETRTDVLHGLIRTHPLGLLISAGPDGPVADAVPFLLDETIGPHGRLTAHVARANPHWRSLSEKPEQSVLVVFKGADAYVTPSWYASKREHGKVVPTWNYAMVQVRGRVTVRDDADWLTGQIEALTRSHEAERAHPWAVADAPEPFVAAQIRAIVGLEIDITGIAGKWKVSQNRPVPDRVGVAEGLEAGGGENPMAGLVRSFGGLPPQG